MKASGPAKRQIVTILSKKNAGMKTTLPSCCTRLHSLSTAMDPSYSWRQGGTGEPASAMRKGDLRPHTKLYRYPQDG
jgi:hypothetical protein